MDQDGRGNLTTVIWTLQALINVHFIGFKKVTVMWVIRLKYQ